MAQNQTESKTEHGDAAAQIDPKEVKSAVARLKAEFKYGDARKLLERIVKVSSDESSDLTWYMQQLALCTYKDKEILPARRFRGALELLEKIDLLDPNNKNAETLALGGAVHKRMWDHHGQLENLYEALFFYRASFERNPGQDLGYGGINAAYVLNILAARTRVSARRKGDTSDRPDNLEASASDLRKRVIDQLDAAIEKDATLADQHWLAVTLAEAHYGLGSYAEAGKWLVRAKKLDPSEWKIQTTFRQLASIARLQGIALPEESTPMEKWHGAWQVLSSLLEKGTATALSCYRGKVGLALSGGGFRASFFHLGVMARLAEIDALRSVETLSTVSGGSIVGAHYYLEVKRLLKKRKDEDITRQDYIDIVRRVQDRFLKGVQQNIRMRALVDFRKNLEMVFSKSYSRSHRLGELYEDELYAGVEDQHPENQPRKMKKLLILPREETDGFHPKFSNWRRRSKVPALLLNATSLNTGHNWHFTARFMGEPPGLLGGEVDKNSRYRRLWYDQAPTNALKNYRLGHAVAASACVPGLFEPLKLDGLYPDKTVQLVDGGVHDNQGVAGLLDEGCSFILCSDASGQMTDVDKPSNGLPAVLMRSNSVMMDRVREAEYLDLRSRTDSRAIQGLFFVHLKKNLHVSAQDWIACQDPTPEAQKAERPLPYGIDVRFQKLIAGIRTDLDSFTDVEAYALMCSGYLMTEQQIQALQTQHRQSGETDTWGGYQVDAPREAWPFLELEEILNRPDKFASAGKDLRRQLEVAGSLAFKIWKLDTRLKVLAGVSAAIIVIVLAMLIKASWGTQLFSLALTVGGVTTALGLVLVALYFPASKWLFPEKASRGIVRKILIALFGYLAARIHLGIFDKMFLERGKLSRLLNLKSGGK